MISLGAISRDIMFRDEATAVLTAHATYTWNKAGTRIRCNGDTCGVVLEAPDGPDGFAAVAVFARHQAEQLPAREPAEPDSESEVIAQPEVTEATAVPAAEEHTPAIVAVIPDPEPDLAIEEAPGEHVETAIAETAPATKVRRDTKALTATIAEINKGDRVSAGFNHPRYGIFTIEGTVVKGGAGLDRNQLMVGGWYINLNDRAAKHLHELAIVAPAGQHEYAIPKPSELTEHVGIGG